ncbi:MAG: response regulator [Proteobacteria bacterium]|nr:response regulator [Pseudomonadota bacterium]
MPTFNIARKLVLAVVVTSTLVALMTTTVQVFADYRREVTLVEESLDHIGIGYVPGLVSSLWSLNSEVTERQLQGILYLPDIDFVRVQSEGQDFTKGHQTPRGHSIVREFPLSYADPVLGKQIDLGSLHVVATLGRVEQEIMQRTILILIANFVKTFLVSFLLMVLFNRMISRHLTDLAVYFRQLTKAKLSAPFVLRRTPGPRHQEDELDVVAASINKMQSELQTAMTELAMSRDAAQAAVRAEALFLANVSHEVRTPLTAIAGYTGLLSEPNLDSAAKQSYSEVIQRNVRTLRELIDNLLEASKSETGRFKRIDEVIRITDFFNHLTATVQLEASKKGVVIATEMGAKTPQYVYAARALIEKIVLNLLGNAVKFTSQGRVRIVVDMATSGTLRVDVIDTGIGISDEFKTMIFTPFAQEDDTKQRGFPGTGLGLHLARQLARSLGGDLLLLRSSKDQGSHFSLQLPVQVVEEPPAAPPLDGKLNHAATSVSGTGDRRCRVLLVEDNEDTAALLGCLLQRHGALITRVANGVEALAATKKHGFEVILMDIEMPGMNGIEALTQLRQAGCKTPVIATTANSMQHEIASYHAAGFADVVEKPLDESKLLDVIATYAQSHPEPDHGPS